MSTIEVDGFLGEQAEEFRLNIIAEHSELFELSKDINKLMMAFMRRQQIGDGFDSKLVVFILLCRIVESAQCIHVLLERGFMPPAKVLTRAMLESYFILVALQKKPGLLEFYFNQHQEGRKKALKAACQFKSKELKASAKKHDLEGKYVEQKKALAGKELRVLSPKEWAVKAEMEDFYNLQYVSYSNSTHSNLSALDDHFDSDENSTDLAFGPSDNGLYDCLKCCMALVANAGQLTAQAYGDDISSELAIFKGRLKLIEKNYQD